MTDRQLRKFLMVLLWIFLLHAALVFSVNAGWIVL